MAFLDDEVTHLSQLASDPVNPAAPRLAADGPLDFRGAFGSQAPPHPGLQAANRAGDGVFEAAQAVVAAAAAGGGKPPQQLRPPRQGKLFNDPIHGSFRLDPTVIDVVDSRFFQRLRRLKQLGLAYQVFPGASHNRFEHSLGVAHLSYKLGHHLWSMQRGELDMDRRDLLVVELAGACHDLGHGPFSHVFDRELLRAKGITNWEHEDMSGKMFDAILDEKCIDTLREDERKRVQAMITAAHGDGGVGTGKRWLTDIVANGRNSIDVDKFDYLLRDSHYCGVKISFDLSRVMQFTKVIGDEICFKYSEYMNLHELFHSRASMHRQVYTHRKAKAIEFMVVDALLEADRVLRLTDKIWDVNSFVQLDDGVLELVEGCGRGGVLGPLLQLDGEQEQALAAAQAVIARLRKRDLYKFCSEALVPQEMVDRGQWRMPTESEIVAHCTGSGLRLRPQDIILNEVKIDHSLGTKNPLDHTSFFDDFYSTTSRRLKPYQITGMVPACFQEKSIRVYSRNSSPAHVAAVHAAFDNWTRSRFGTSFKGSSTPLKMPLHRTGAPPPPVGAGLAAAVAAGAAAAAAGGDAGVGVKRSRELFGRQREEDDTSPSNLLRTKQRRQAEQHGS